MISSSKNSSYLIFQISDLLLVCVISRAELEEDNDLCQSHILSEDCHLTHPFYEFIAFIKWTLLDVGVSDGEDIVPAYLNMACQALTQSNPYPSHLPIFTTLRFPSGHTGFFQSLISLLLLGLCTCCLPFWFHLPSPFCLLWGLSSDSPSAEKPPSLSIWVPIPCVFAPWLPTELDSQMLCKSPLKGIIHQHLKVYLFPILPSSLNSADSWLKTFSW